jgi:hypothetical protein
VFPPSSSRGTFVLCATKSGKFAPHYFEGDVETYPTPMIEKDGEMVEADNSEPTITIDVKH